MTCLAAHANRITPLRAAIVEPVAGGRLLLLATEERFGMDNPAHLAAAAAIWAALAPIPTWCRQKTCPDSGRAAGPRRSRADAFPPGKEIDGLPTAWKSSLMVRRLARGGRT